MQRENAKSFYQARVRAFGSLFGGSFGMLIVFVYEAVLMNVIVNNLSYNFHFLTLYTLISVFLVLLIYVMVMFKQHDLIFVAILTYLSITISLRNNLPVLVFGIERISSTIIGVMIALLVNKIHLYHNKNSNILFVS
jgi:hypothetical protein